MRRLATAALVGGIVTGTVARLAAGGDDVVHLKTASGDAATSLAGEIVEYTGRELKLRSAIGRERSIPAGQIERVETTYCAEQRAADALFAKRDYRAALEKYRQALSTAREPRAWVRRQILAQIVWCQRNLGQDDQAGEYFLILLAGDPYTRLFDCIPLAWTLEPPTPETVRKAQSWLASKNPAAELIGASLLVATDQRPAALDHLRRLTSDPDKRIAWLAEAQLWRGGSPPSKPEQMRAWTEAMEASDPSLRAGACYLLGVALAPQAPEKGALVLMRVPVLYERENRLAAAALLAAGACLEKIGRPSQAAALYRELAARHPQAAEAAEALRRLQSLASLEAARDN